MPTIPVLSGNQVGARPLPQVSPARIVDTRGQSIGNALSEAGGIIASIQKEARDNADLAAVTKAHSTLNAWVNDALYTSDNAALKQEGQNAFGLEQKVLPKYQEQVNTLSSGLSTPRQKRMFSQAAADIQNQVRRQLGQYELGQTQAYYDNIDQSARKILAQRGALNYRDPDVLQQSLRDTVQTAVNQAKRHGLDETGTQAEVMKATDDYHGSVVIGMLSNGDVQSASKYLYDNFMQLTPQTSESLQRMLLTTEERAVSVVERQRKLAGDELSKEGDALLHKGQLSPSWIEHNKQLLDPADVRYFYRALSGEGDAPRNPMLYADLRDRAGKGEDVRDDARDALRRGVIRVGDYDRLLSEVEQERPGWYKRGSEYISTMSGVSQLNPDPSAAQTKATMLDQWGDWAQAHPDASDREAQVAYQDIVSHNMLVQLAGLPLPKYIVGSRLQMDLKSTEAATVKALQDGQIDKAEFDRQALILKKWRQAMQNTQPKAMP